MLQAIDGSFHSVLSLHSVRAAHRAPRHLKLMNAARRLTSQERPWYAEDGLRFTCSQCGNCCSGSPGYVHFTNDEGTRMANRLGISVQAFYDRYTFEQDGLILLKEIPSSSGLDCILLDRDEDGKGVCSVYADRPMQCKTWPFWPENLVTEAAWEDAKASTPCAGMNTGDHHNLDLISSISEQDAKATTQIGEEALERARARS